MAIIKTGCVYSITCLITGERYVGQTANRPGRWRDHRFILNAGTAANKRLQEAWFKYGETNFEFEVLEEGEYKSRAALLAQETYWIEQHQTTIEGKGFNVRGYTNGHRPAYDARPESVVVFSDADQSCAGEAQMYLNLLCDAGMYFEGSEIKTEVRAEAKLLRKVMGVDLPLSELEYEYPKYFKLMNELRNETRVLREIVAQWKTTLPSGRIIWHVRKNAL